jgi:endonuclease YncB( thermonuclease family)
MRRVILLAVLLLSTLTACELAAEDLETAGDDVEQTLFVDSVPSGEVGVVVNVVDGDTIDVVIDGQEYRVRYVGINTPERDEPCYNAATEANSDLVMGQTVTLVRDETDTDRFDRLLRYIYVDDVFVNATLVVNGYAEAALYRPDDRHYAAFADYEREAAAANRNCHNTGIFDDGNPER